MIRYFECPLPDKVLNLAHGHEGQLGRGWVHVEVPLLVPPQELPDADEVGLSQFMLTDILAWTLDMANNFSIFKVLSAVSITAEVQFQKFFA